LGALATRPGIAQTSKSRYERLDGAQGGLQVTTHATETSPLTLARVAGLVYLLGLPAPFGLIYVPSRLIVSGDAAATAANIVASETLFRLGIVSNLYVSVVNLVLVVALYRLLKPVGKNMALLMVMFVVAGVAIAMLSEMTQFAVLRLLLGADYRTVFTTDQLQALALLFLNMHSQGVNIAQIFWGLWLFPLGYLVFKSAFLPRSLGLLLLIAGFGYLTQSFFAFLAPGLKLNIAFITGWGELVLLLWLLIRGVNIEKWAQWTPKPA
jgi:hypothetical protein